MNKVIVSFTSYPKKMKNVGRVIESIKKQTSRPDKLVLYLAKKQFNGIQVSSEVTNYLDEWFEIHWCDQDLLSYKKFYYAFIEYPDDTIITIDDDIIYDERAIEELLYYHERFPGCVIGRRGCMITWTNDHTVSDYSEWCDVPSNFIATPRHDILITTGGGTLFPPGIYGSEVLNLSVFMVASRYADDIWLKIMQIIYDIQVVLVRRFFCDEFLMDDYSIGLYANHNKNGGNDNQLQNLIRKYNVDIGKACFRSDSIMVFEAKRILEQDFDGILLQTLKKVDDKACIVLYGAGKEALRYYSAMDRIEYSEMVYAFVVSQMAGNPDNIMGVPVFVFDRIKNIHAKILLAVSIDKQKAIIEALVKSGIKKTDILSVYYEEI